MLLEKIQQNASLLAKHPAYRCGEDSLTYSQLWNAASLLAAQLQDGAGAVALIGTKQPMMAVGMLGSLLAGRPYLPLSSDQPKERLQRILSQANPGTVIDCREAKAEQWLKREPAMQNFLIPGNPSRDAYWLFTSGSSGSPKGCASPLPRWKISCAGFVRSQPSAPERNREPRSIRRSFPSTCRWPTFGLPG